MVSTVIGSKGTLVDVNTAAIARFVSSWTRSTTNATLSIDANVVAAVVVIGHTLVSVDALVSIRTELEARLTNNWEAIRATQKVATTTRDFTCV